MTNTTEWQILHSNLNNACLTDAIIGLILIGLKLAFLFLVVHTSPYFKTQGQAWAKYISGQFRKIFERSPNPGSAGDSKSKRGSFMAGSGARHSQWPICWWLSYWGPAIKSGGGGGGRGGCLVLTQ